MRRELEMQRGGGVSLLGSKGLLHNRNGGRPGGEAVAPRDAGGVDHRDGGAGDDERGTHIKKKWQDRAKKRQDFCRLKNKLVGLLQSCPALQAAAGDQTR